MSGHLAVQRLRFRRAVVTSTSSMQEGNMPTRDLQVQPSARTEPLPHAQRLQPWQRRLRLPACHACSQERSDVSNRQARASGSHAL